MPLWKKLVLTVLGISTTFVWYAVFQESREGLAVHFLDVGQGDSVLIQADNGVQIVIDGGPGESVLSKLGDNMPFYDRYIDVLVLTHPDADHLHGLVEILGRYTVGHIVETGVLHDTAQYHEWRARITDAGIPVVQAVAGGQMRIAENLTMEVLAPFRLVEGTQPKDVNETSIVLRMDYGEISFLFTGDIETKSERMLSIFARDRLDADILKVAHHGSKTSSSEEFLRAVTPEVAVISVGRNNTFQHPHTEVLQRYQEASIPVYRTDISGTITVQVYPDGTYIVQ
jgi:competence protein ComEC